MRVSSLPCSGHVRLIHNALVVGVHTRGSSFKHVGQSAVVLCKSRIANPSVGISWSGGITRRGAGRSKARRSLITSTGFPQCVELARKLAQAHFGTRGALGGQGGVLQEAAASGPSACPVRAGGTQAVASAFFRPSLQRGRNESRSVERLRRCKATMQHPTRRCTDAGRVPRWAGCTRECP